MRDCHGQLQWVQRLSNRAGLFVLEPLDQTKKPVDHHHVGRPTRRGVSISLVFDLSRPPNVFFCSDLELSQLVSALRLIEDWITQG